MQHSKDSESPRPEDDRWHLIRDLLVFQLKLMADGLRDLALVPISLVAGIYGLLVHPRPSEPFHEVLALGKRSERWINLFGALPRRRSMAETLRGAREGGIDEAVERLERVLRDQYERGGVTAGAKSAIDRSLDVLSARQKAPAENSEKD